MEQAFSLVITHAFWLRWSIILHHIVRAVTILVDVTLSSAAESLDGILLSFLHSGATVSTTIFDDWDRLASVDVVSSHRVTTQISNALDWVGLASNGALVRLHDLLNLFTNVAQAHINACSFDSSVSCILAGQQQIVILGVKCNSEGAISHQAFDVTAIVDLHHVVPLKHRFVIQIWGPVSRTVI